MPVATDLYYHAYEGSEEGRRPPVVLIHGAGGTHLYWPSELRRLPGYRVFALDLPGHGKSGGCGQQSTQAYANVVLDWMAALGMHRAVFVGHSMGSAIALSLALDHAEHVLGLGLVAAGARLRVAPQLLESTASPTTFHGAIQSIIARSFGPQAPERLVELAAQRMAETRPSVLHADFLVCDAFDEMQRVAQIQQPALIVCGEDDRMTPLRYAQFLADSLPNATLETVPGAGHMVMLEQPQAVTAALSAFLEQIVY
ncbi:MAG: alpha/beta hydrolase [Anaerolineales bacterium]|nr:alpha/beta hydrolase [Anaerolineales bacterium]